MPDAKLHVQHRKGGLGEKFTLALHNVKSGSLKSSQYNIDNLAIICFHLRFDDKLKTDLVISTKKCENVHSSVKMNVTCTKCSGTRLSEQWFCTDGWSEKYLLREIVFDSEMFLENIDIYTFNFEVNVIASKMIMIGPSLYEDENFTDFRLSTVDGSVGVHKASLAAHSDMFKAMLNGEWKETVEGRIEVEGASLQTLQALKDFMYLGKLPEEGLQTLLQIAIRFFIESLKKECIIKLAQNVKPEEYLELLDFARDNEIVELTFALVQLTPQEVINSAYEKMITSKQLPEAGDKTDKE